MKRFLAIPVFSLAVALGFLLRDGASRLDSRSAAASASLHVPLRNQPQAAPQDERASDSEEVIPRISFPVLADTSPVPAELPHASEDVQADPARLREWLLTIPDADLRLLVGHPEMDRYVLGAVGAQNASAGDPYRVERDERLVGEFLDRINARIREVQGISQSPMRK